MADLNDLNYRSITSMSLEEGVALILTIRENRRRVKAEPKPAKVIKKQKAKALPNLSAMQAERILKLLNS